MCVGYIGGKTQTDIATMDDLYLDALGITDEDDLMELKGTKKKKGKKIDDPDFMVSRPGSRHSSAFCLRKILCLLANDETNYGEGGTQSRASHSSDDEQESVVEATHKDQGTVYTFFFFCEVAISHPYFRSRKIRQLCDKLCACVATV